jgi:hypothetical protein
LLPEYNTEEDYPVGNMQTNTLISNDFATKATMLVKIKNIRISLLKSNSSQVFPEYVNEEYPIGNSETGTSSDLCTISTFAERLDTKAFIIQNESIKSAEALNAERFDTRAFIIQNESIKSAEVLNPVIDKLPISDIASIAAYNDVNMIMKDVSLPLDTCTECGPSNRY